LVLCVAALLLSCAPGETKAGLSPNEPSAVVDLLITPATDTVFTDGTLTFSAIAVHQDSTHTVPEVTWTATGGSISVDGVYRPSGVAGNYTVTAILVGGNLTSSAAVTVLGASSPIVSLSVSPGSASLATGGTRQFVATATRQDGSTFTPAVIWLATGGTISTGGLYTAGQAGGNFLVTAAQQGGALADTSAVTVTAAAPVLQAVLLAPGSTSVATGNPQQFAVSGQWSNGATTAPSVTYTATGGTITSGGLYTAGPTVGSYRVIATQQGGGIADTSAVTITAPVSGPHANRPVNYTTVISDYAFNDVPPASADAPMGTEGWNVVFASGGGLTRETDPTAPISPTNVLQWHYGPGHTAGTGVGNVYREVDPSITEFYVAFSVWHDSNYEWNSISNKLFYIEPGNIILQSRHNNEYLSVYIGQSDVNYAPTNPRPIPLGQWVNIEYQVKRGPSGFIRVWMNGVLVTSYTGINVPAGDGQTQELKLDSTWGGQTGPTTRDSYRRIDHILIATP
jgi:hypothetical protein